MTGNLDMLKVFRDIRVGIEVGRKAKLGWFDVEFTMYGSVCYHPQEKKRYYRISSRQEDIYDFIENSMLQDVYASDLMTHTIKCAVPAGMQEEIANEVKRELAKKLKEQYTKDYFIMLYALADSCDENGAEEILWAECEDLEGTFDKERLTMFKHMVEYAYKCKTLSKRGYQNLMEWYQDELKNMDDDFISKDIFEVTMYGAGYIDEQGKIKFVSNAKRENIYGKLYEYQRKGLFVTPVISKTYWYNYEYRLQDVIVDFKAELIKKFDDHTISHLKMLGHTEAKTPNEIQKALIHQITLNNEDKPVSTMQRYLSQWGILQL